MSRAKRNLLDEFSESQNKSLIDDMPETPGPLTGFIEEEFQDEDNFTIVVEDEKDNDDSELEIKNLEFESPEIKEEKEDNQIINESDSKQEVEINKSGSKLSTKRGRKPMVQKEDKDILKGKEETNKSEMDSINKIVKILALKLINQSKENISIDGFSKEDLEPIWEFIIDKIEN